MKRRMAGNQRMPRWSGFDDGETLMVAVHGLRAWAHGETPQNIPARPEIVRRIDSVVRPALLATAWPRWLFLERAFFDAGATGDLLFAALVLRTMCQEVQRLHALDLGADKLAALASSSDRLDQERLQLFVKVAWATLDNLPQPTILEGEDWPRLKIMATEMPQLEKARAALNSYVHPNYGSHIAALFPESASAARLLLAAVVALYEAFFSLSWSERPVTGASVPTGIGALESWPRSVRRLQSQTLPEARGTAGNSELAEVMKAPALIEWLTVERKRNDLTDMVRDPTLAPLLDQLPRRKTMGGVAHAVATFKMWEGAGAIDILHLVAARQAEQLLTREFPSGAPGPSDQVRFVRFTSLSLQLAVLIDQVKAAAFKVQLVRQITQGNSVGAWLCMRSLIEYRALVVWLPQKVGISLDSLAEKLHAGLDLPADAAAVGQPVANFLASQAKNSTEDRRSWVMAESGDIRTAWLNLDQVVEEAFPKDDRFQTLYALASASMHGRHSRARDLVRNPNALAAQARSLGLIVLERLCDRNEEMDHLSASLVQFVRLEHAGNVGGTTAATTDDMAQKAFGDFKGGLEPGVDYSGDGTAENPFRFGGHLQFHQASYALLEQLGIDLSQCRRELIHDGAERLYDRWHAPGRDFWFHVPIIP
jgi:hypothetical protein